MAADQHLLSQLTQSLSFYSFIEEHGTGPDPYLWYKTGAAVFCFAGQKPQPQVQRQLVQLETGSQQSQRAVDVATSTEVEPSTPTKLLPAVPESKSVSCSVERGGSGSILRKGSDGALDGDLALQPAEVDVPDYKRGLLLLPGRTKPYKCLPPLHHFELDITLLQGASALGDGGVGSSSSGKPLQRTASHSKLRKAVYRKSRSRSMSGDWVGA